MRPYSWPWRGRRWVAGGRTAGVRFQGPGVRDETRRKGATPPHSPNPGGVQFSAASSTLSGSTLNKQGPPEIRGFHPRLPTLFPSGEQTAEQGSHDEKGTRRGDPLPQASVPTHGKSRRPQTRRSALLGFVSGADFFRKLSLFATLSDSTNRLQRGRSRQEVALRAVTSLKAT